MTLKRNIRGLAPLAVRTSDRGSESQLLTICALNDLTKRFPRHFWSRHFEFRLSTRYFPLVLSLGISCSGTCVTTTSLPPSFLWLGFSQVRSTVHAFPSLLSLPRAEALILGPHANPPGPFKVGLWREVSLRETFPEGVPYRAPLKRNIPGLAPLAVRTSDRGSD